MSQENIEIVRAAYERSSRGDLSWASEADDFELITSRENPDAGTFRGAEGSRWLTAWRESFDGYTVEPTEIIDAGDKVFAAIVQRGRPHGSGTEVEEHWCQVVTVRGGLIIRLETFRDRAEALKAAGLSAGAGR
jgi:uncharacterized protein